MSQRAESQLHILDDGFSFSLQINIDGLPLFKSKNDQFWPILGKVQNVCDETPFIISMFSRHSKPSNLNDYLQKFIGVFNALTDNGFDLNVKHFNVKLDSIICDAPARDLLSVSRVIPGIQDVISVHSLAFMLAK